MQSSTFSRSIPPNDTISILDKNNDISNVINIFLSTDFYTLKVSNARSLKQKDVEGSSSIFSINTTVPGKEQSQQQMKFEVELIRGFRGRTKGHYKPVKALRRNGAPSEPRKPNYFSDRNNNHYLNLLIPEMLLSGDLRRRVRIEICIITRTINGCIYIHPYFKFYNPLTFSSDNPILINLGHDNKYVLNNEEYELKRYAEGIQKMLLYLVVVMLKNDELIENQPIKPFQSPKSNGQVNTKKYDKVDEFKNDCYLNDLRFATTLWIKEHDENEYRRCDYLQYISEISIEDKNYKSSS